MVKESVPAELIKEAGLLWEAKAEFWDELMGDEGNQFYRELVAPAQMRLLDLKPANHVLEIACGNGVATRDVARVARRVVACDFSPTMVEASRRRARSAGLSNIDFHVVDATDEAAMRALGQGVFDAALCSMALMDIPVLDPLMRAAKGALKAGGRFVFSMSHPCFNHSGATMAEELTDLDGTLVPTFSMKVNRYLAVPLQCGAGARDEPNPHYYFHRPLSQVLSSAFEAGFVLDALAEPSFAEREPERRSFAWRNYRQIPPILVGRLRPV